MLIFQKIITTLLRVISQWG